MSRNKSKQPKFLNPFIPLGLFAIGFILAAAGTPIGFLFVLAGIITTLCRYVQACSHMRGATKALRVGRSPMAPSSQRVCIEPTNLDE